MTGPHPAVAAVRTAVRRGLADLPPGGLVLVACSGGADSLALAAATAFVAERSRRRGPAPGLRAGAVVVDHGLQAGSAAVAARAAEACRGLGLDPVEVVAVDVAPVGGPEGAARAARHAALADAAARHGAAAVLLGHTLDDQAEGVLLGLARGSGPRSLAGMPARRGVLRRPLLGLRRSQTAAACTALGLEPWQDPTNAPGPGAPRRSRVRGEVLPVLEAVLGPGVVPALARSADASREAADALDALGAALLAAAASAASAGEPDARPGAGLDVATLAAAHPGV
ncbi:tRNA lysidine(34) synthetase TilS, partial [Cellulomonas endophytica]|uniref:tRNA lysidine(34) synthetase TilS n=1 Tax=Cellulomonas endophytica TaxID=2494735 RepID=UPI0010102AAF